MRSLQKLVMLAVMCAAGRSLWQECVLLAVCVVVGKSMFLI